MRAHLNDKSSSQSSRKPSSNCSFRIIFSFVTLLFSANCQPLFATDRLQILGDILQVVLPVSAFALTLKHHDTEGTRQFGESFGTTLGVTYALKYGINENRPNGGKHSFPSGHTSAAFSAAEFIQKRYGGKGALWYVISAFVAYSRVESRQHYTHDVVAGAVIGILGSDHFTRHYKDCHIKVFSSGKSQGLEMSRDW